MRHSKLSSRSPSDTPTPHADDVKQDSRQDAGPQRCGECGVKVESTAALESHMASAHKNTYQCIKCQVSADHYLIIKTISPNFGKKNRIF